MPGDVYTEHYYLDGVRRIQEVHNNPVFPSGGGSEEQSMGEETGGSVANRTWVDREYIHTTGYPHGYVDETVCETDEFDYPWYHLQDANYNVTAIVHESGFVASQRTLDPYGQVIRHQQFLAHPPSRVGHQGLFFDRLDAGLTASGRLPESLVTTGGAGGTTPVAVLGAYQNRNRTYLPQYDRFGQGDPKGTGGPTLEHLVYSGRSPATYLGDPSDAAILQDGPNRHAAYGHSPLAHADPSGLWFGMAAQLATMAIDNFSAANGTLQEAYDGIQTFLTTRSMLFDYSVMQMADVEWATDWSLPDDSYTRGSEFIQTRGSWSPDAPSYSGAASDGFAIGARLRVPEGLGRREAYEAERAGWSGVRRAQWKIEAQNPTRQWTDAALNRMRQGLAPRGWVMHHRNPLALGGTNNPSNLVMMRASDHRKYSRLIHDNPPRIRLPGPQSVYDPKQRRWTTRPGVWIPGRRR